MLGKRIFHVARLCAATAIILLSSLFCQTAMAQDIRNYTVQTFLDWLQKYQHATPDFKPGDILTAKDQERIRPFVPPGVLEDLDFPTFRMEIIPARNHTPRRDYVECTEKHQNQVKLAGDGAMVNYVCGQPFPNSALDIADPASGTKTGWNWNYRWQHYGIVTGVALIIWDRFGGAHAGYSPTWEAPPDAWAAGVGGFTFAHPADPAEVFGGEGQFTRTLQLLYSRLYYTHLAPLAHEGGALPLPSAKEFEYKEFVGFFTPYDIQGTAFISYRYEDPHRADDAWAYIPTIRRVRRISVEVKSDSLLGTVNTLEDFYSFTGRPLAWDWHFLGWKDLLSVMDSKYDYEHVYGPKGIVPNDVWSLRRFAVVQRTPKDPRYPYSTVLNFWDAENWDASWEIAFDKRGRLWKIWHHPKRWSEDFETPAYARINHGTQLTNFQGVQIEDVQEGRGNVWPVYCGYPTPNLKVLGEFYKVNMLETVHR